MSTGLLIGIIVATVVVVVLVAVLAVAASRRRARLREKFGPEYDRAVEDNSGKLAAERDLQEREQRHEQLDIRPLSPAAHEHYSRSWARVQQEFVDRPNAAVVAADRVLTSLMADRGYPTEGFEQQVADLSVEHARTLENYRTAHGIMQRQQDGNASTEDLRSAMLHFRTLFEELLVTPEPHAEPQVPKHSLPNQPAPQPDQQSEPSRPDQPSRPGFVDDTPTPALGQPQQRPQAPQPPAAPQQAQQPPAPQAPAPQAPPPQAPPPQQPPPQQEQPWQPPDHRPPNAGPRH